jgi:predicted peptidase
MSKRVFRGKQQGLTFEHAVRLCYLLFLPKQYRSSSTQRWPLNLFLHGIGERGDDLELVKVHGLAKVVEQRPDFPFVVVSPQCPDGTLWSDHHLTLKGLLDVIMAEYSVDRDRVYLTGLSMGGYGTWSLAMTYPDLFAAIAPICGGGIPDWVGVLKEVPVWAFHGAEDTVVPLEQSQRMVQALQADGGSAKLTVYPGVGHDSWTQTYDNQLLYDWFLQHSR